MTRADRLLDIPLKEIIYSLRAELTSPILAPKSLRQEDGQKFEASLSKQCSEFPATHRAGKMAHWLKAVQVRTAPTERPDCVLGRQALPWK